MKKEKGKRMRFKEMTFKSQQEAYFVALFSYSVNFLSFSFASNDGDLLTFFFFFWIYRRLFNEPIFLLIFFFSFSLFFKISSFIIIFDAFVLRLYFFLIKPEILVANYLKKIKDCMFTLSFSSFFFFFFLEFKSSTG